MIKTANILGVTIKENIIFLIEELVPYSFCSCDGLFNLGSGLAFVQVLPKGVYIVINGKYLNYKL